MPDSELKRFRRFLLLSRFKIFDISQEKKCKLTKSPFLMSSCISVSLSDQGRCRILTGHDPIGGDSIRWPSGLSRLLRNVDPPVEAGVIIYDRVCAER